MIDYQAARARLSEAEAAQWSIRTADPSQDLFVTGPCPGCGATLEFRVDPDPVVVAMTESGEPTRITRSLHCNCRESHPKRPEAVVVGCGRTWTLTIVRSGSGDTVEPGDPALDEAADALDMALRTQLTTLTAAAEKWIAGVTAILGLLGIAGVAVGKDGVGAIGGGGKVVAGLAVGAAVAAAVIAIVSGYKAAYGWPRDLKDDVALREWHENRAQRVRDRLVRSVTAAVTSLVLLAAAVAVVWFAPDADPPRPKVKVTYNEDGDPFRPASACGTLLDTKSAKLRITVTTGATTDTRTVPAQHVTAIEAKATCEPAG